jgi:hypothetical protein
VPSFCIESWSAIAPGLETSADWEQWLHNPIAIDGTLGKVNMTAVPALLRRRFSPLGKAAMATAMPLVEELAEIPSIFASRHGDTALSLSLLQGIARGDPMSPTSFSLAVHNAVSGLFSIARKDTSAVTAIAAMDGLLLQTLFEAVGQLQSCERLLCVVYDIPLPDFYQTQRDQAAIPFPWALAMILGNHQGDNFQLELISSDTAVGDTVSDFEAFGLMRVLCGIADDTTFQQARACWQLSRVTG